MRLLCRMFIAAVVLFLFCPPFTAIAEQDKQAAGVVAKVGSLAITATDVYLRAQVALPMQVSFHGGVTAEKVEEVKLEALEELIVRAYKVQYAINEEISLDATAFESEWQKKLSKNKLLAENPQAPEYSMLKAYLYLDLLASKAETVAVEEKLTVTDQDISDFYAKNKAMYLRPTLYTASHVFIRVDPASNAEEREEKLARAEDIYKRAQGGDDFYDLAYYESDDRSKYVGGSLGSFHAGQTVPEFDAAIKSMKQGEVAAPVRTIYGYHVIKLDALDGERQLQFDEVAGKIRANMEETERKEIYDQWMSTLKEKYTLERFDQQPAK